MTHAIPDFNRTVDDLFRRESAKLISLLTKIFGPKYFELAEDVVQDTLLKALHQWKIQGPPRDPSAWLFTAARNKALDVIRRERLKTQLSAELASGESAGYPEESFIENIFSTPSIDDEQLRMMFVCCHPSIPEESQVAMILKTLCGFSVAEIASVFFTNEETITKRLYRAREQFRKEKIDFRIPETDELPERLTSVLTSVYLLFSQGYHASHHESLVRSELIEESLRLCKMITDNPTTRVPESLALLALICFHAARITSRIDEHGNFISLRFQDRSQWNTELIDKGSQLLREASTGTIISVYHIQAAIAYEHCLAKNFQQTNWKQILAHYDLWYQLQPFAVIALNRAIVLAEVEGPAAALAVLDQLQLDHTVKNYYLLASAKAEFYHQLKRNAEAKTYYEKAMTQTTSPTEKKYLQEKIDRLSH